MDGRPPAQKAGRFLSGQHHVAGNLNLRTVYEEPPPRGALSFAYFSLGKQRKVRLNTQKIFLNRMSTTRPSIEERFCESTLEKEGTITSEEE